MSRSRNSSRARRQRDWTNGITVAVMAQRFTPRQAARVKYLSLLFDEMDPEGREWFHRLLDNDIEHQWFCFCLDAVARREN